MIRGELGQIRGAEPDDAEALQRLYDLRRPRAALLDQRMECVLPTRDELAELLAKKEATQGQLFSVEDAQGDLVGFCSLRGAHPEARFAEAALLMLEDADYESPLADVALDFVVRRAFVQLRLNKVFAQCLGLEVALRECLVRNHFASEGQRREVLYAGGKRHNLEALARFARDFETRGAA
jgi:RimJ/RimL family protein N-acetyltransferase